MSINAAFGAAGTAGAADQHTHGIAHDIQHLMQLLRSRATYISRTLAWEYVAMGVAEINAVACCASALARELEPAPGRRVGALDVVCAIKHMQTLLRTVSSPSTQLTYRIAPGAALVRLSVAALERVMINLVSNARNAGASEVEIRVSTELDRTAGWATKGPAGAVIVSVQDNGSGLDESRLAEASCRNEAGSEVTWFGIGLRSVSAIVLGAGGELEFSTPRNEGLLTRVSLPLTHP